MTATEYRPDLSNPNWAKLALAEAKRRVEEGFKGVPNDVIEDRMRERSE